MTSFKKTYVFSFNTRQNLKLAEVIKILSYVTFPADVHPEGPFRQTRCDNAINENIEPYILLQQWLLMPNELQPNRFLHSDSGGDPRAGGEL